jgi:hypothetical protein
MRREAYPLPGAATASASYSYKKLALHSSGEASAGISLVRLLTEPQRIEGIYLKLIDCLVC